MQRTKTISRILLLSAVMALNLFFFYSCSKEIVPTSNFTSRSGAQSKKVRRPIVSENPLDDYVKIQEGIYNYFPYVTIGTDSIADRTDRRPSQGGIKVSTFYIQKYEVTNHEYRQFVQWIRDSLAHTYLGHFIQNNDSPQKRLDWSRPINWEDERLDKLYYQGDNRFAGRKEYNPELFIYNGPTRLHIYPDTLVWEKDFPYTYNEPITRNYFWHPAYNNYPVVGVSYDMAMAYCHWKMKEVFKNKYEVRLPTEAEWEYAALAPLGNGTDEVMTDRRIYPWNGGSYVAIHRKKGLRYNCNGGRVMDKQNNIAFDFVEDGFNYTAPVNAYLPNDWELYQMAGNVAEWTSDEISNTNYIAENLDIYRQIVQKVGYQELVSETFSEIAERTKIAYQDTLEVSLIDITYILAAENDQVIRSFQEFHKLIPPYFFDRFEGYKIVKGGSWADPSYYMQVASRKIESPTKPRSYIGFRTVMTNATENQ